MDTSKYFHYSLLRYCDLRREESLVIGVLLFFPHNKTVCFLSPKNLERLKVAFPDSPLRTIQVYFNAFEERADALNRLQADLPNSNPKIAALIAAHFLIEDSSVLQFSEPRIAVLPHTDSKRIARNFYERYLQNYEMVRGE